MERQGIEITTEPEDFAVLLELAELPNKPRLAENCIYRVPQKARQTKETAYTPSIVSIGPFHHGDLRFKLKEELKLGYLKSFLQGTGLTWEHCIGKLKEWESSIRNCYEESIPLASDDFLRMVLIDAGFIIELFLRHYGMGDWATRDYLLLRPLVAMDVYQDLILLENQLPFFVFEALFNLAIAGFDAANFPTFLQITFKFFEDLNPQNLNPDEVSNVLHFTDLLRIFYLPPKKRLPERTQLGIIVENLYSASELVNAGLKLKVNTTKKCFLELEYHRGILIMPRLEISDVTESHLRNIVALEQNHYPTKTYVTDYLMVLDFLIYNEEDVDILVRNRIITTPWKNRNEVATVISDISSNLVLTNMNSEYGIICKQLNDFCNRPTNMWKQQLKRVLSILISLSLIQTICSIISLFKS